MRAAQIDSKIARLYKTILSSTLVSELYHVFSNEEGAYYKTTLLACSLKQICRLLFFSLRSPSFIILFALS